MARRRGMTIDEAIEDMKKRREKAMEEAVTILESASMANSPVQTGALRRSITSEIVSDDNTTKAVVGSNLDYSGIVEYRTGFLEQTISDNIEEVKQRIGEVLRNG